MQKSQPQPGWWDWASVALLYTLLYTVASRLVATEWTENLNFTQAATVMGAVLGLSLGYSRFKRPAARWLSFGYMVFLLPIIWIRVIDRQVELDERFLSVFGRLLFSASEFFARRPVEDPLFFVALMCIAFWVLSTSAGFYLVRHQNFLVVTLPSAIGILVIQHYDNIVSGRLLFLAFFIFIALFLMGRLKFLQDQQLWRARRVFLSPENGIDLTTGLGVAAALIIVLAFTLPLSLTRVDTFQQTWSRLIKPWTDFTERMENAVSALDSPSGGKPGEFYGTELELGRGFPLTDDVMFRVETPELPFDQKPPRYYWRGRTYDYFSNGQWYMTGTERDEFSPTETRLDVSDSQFGISARFIFTVGESQLSLLYAPSQPVWVSRPSSFLASPAGSALDIYSWNADPSLRPGETYQVTAALTNPTIESLRAAGTQYPGWVTQKYLQLPSDFPPELTALAQEITARTLTTPYDQTMAITRYLRENIQYAETVPLPPRNADPLAWWLFEHKQGYCVYYATSEVMLLRSLGIPARMAVGFAQGTGTASRGIDEAVEGIGVNSYTVLRKNAHAWPEVYFPNIGWVEFEPTGNQSPLDRPLAPREDTDPITPPNLGAAQPETDLDSLEDRLDRFEQDPALADAAAVSPSRYLLPLFIALAALTVYFISRRYDVPRRVPGLVRTVIERTGVEVPPWIMHWERWSALSPTARAFESINLGLRWTGQPAPIHATPIERAEGLARTLPRLAPAIKVLLDEHQTSLYTSRSADEKNARRAAFQVRTQIIFALIRYFWTGHYEAQVVEPQT